ncbi:DUF695 domain-containing protein [Fulvivirga maritima]|uniref:DUF695 domain-containing protein n=1 Tax=Fulvivirga maritima TaxID=2904247 RepID=UPI001F1FE1B0|nr:DUF695 domain-containing protein [Fulvivirga maritima]UII28353.1 DUF695 domain-containing protein [Fulvivirga maritima]
MKLFKSLFNNKGNTIDPYQKFWEWFKKEEKSFYEIIKQGGDIESKVFDKLTPKLNQVHDGIWLLVGMQNNDQAELILTADGFVKNIVFVEELVAAAPSIPNWKITALKPSNEEPLSVKVDDYTFDENTLSFYPEEHPDKPDLIDIYVTHKDLTEENYDLISQGVFLSIDNYLGELNTATLMDHISLITPEEATKELIPFQKLKSYLVWREKEFVEKYRGSRHNTEGDHYSVLEGSLENGLPWVAAVNMDLLQWDAKASHPWITNIVIEFTPDSNGFPDKDTYTLLDKVEDNIMSVLKDYEGYLNIGRETANGGRQIYFACEDFRKPAKVLDNLLKENIPELKVAYEIYKDKYWQTFDHFSVS